MWNGLWGHALSRSPGIYHKSRVSYSFPRFLPSATLPLMPKKHSNGSINQSIYAQSYFLFHLYLCRLYNRCLNIDDSSHEYKLNSINLDIINCRMFKPVNSDVPNESPCKFLNLKFANKGIDAINIGNILNHRDVVRKIPPYFKYLYNIGWP